jgi:hypothetical protein
MKKHIQTAKTYIAAHFKNDNNEVTIGAVVIVIAAILVAMIAYGLTPHYTYQPVKACDIFTPLKAQDLLGDKVYSADKNEPTVVNNISTSKCSYSDQNNDTTKLKVAAIAVRSGTNDAGVAQNKADFSASKTGKNFEIIQGVGDSAYFNHDLGQLNVLSGSKWILLNYGVGATPESNTVKDAIKLAKVVLTDRVSK